MNCLNCTSPAVYSLDNSPAATQNFCAEHLPAFVKLSKHLGNIVKDISKPVVETVKTLPTPPKKKKDEPVFVAPVIEEAPVVEELEVPIEDTI